MHSEEHSAPPQEPFENEAEEEELERERRTFRRNRRRLRDKSSEIKELNITAMMDMMTIILVFLLRSYTASSSTMQMTEDLQIPNSTTQARPQENVNVTITLKEMAVNDKTVAPIVERLVPAEYHEGGDAGHPLILPLLDALTVEVEKQKTIAKYNPEAPFSGKVNIVADKRIPYATVLATLYTAGQAELSQYKLVALKSSE